MLGLSRSHPLPNQLGIRENPGERIVHLVRYHGRHLADGRHSLRVQQMIVGAIEFPRLLLDAIFQRLGPGNDFFVRGAQLQAHFVEGMRQVAHFVMRLHLDLVAKIPLGKMFGAVLERLDGLAAHSPHE